MTSVTDSPTRRRWSLRTYIVGLLLIFVVTAGAAAVFQRPAASNDARHAAPRGPTATLGDST